MLDLEHYNQKVGADDAIVRIRIVRRGLRRLRRQVLLAAATLGRPFEKLPGLQEASATYLVHLQFPKSRVDLRREKGGLFRVQKGQQGRVRAAVNLNTGRLPRSQAHPFRVTSNSDNEAIRRANETPPFT